MCRQNNQIKHQQVFLSQRRSLNEQIEEELNSLEDENSNSQMTCPQIPQKSTFLVRHHREFPGNQASIEWTQEELYRDVLHFKELHQKYLYENHAVNAKLVQALTRVVETPFPSFSLKIYGSYATGLNMPWSDLDLFFEKSKIDDLANETVPFELEALLKAS